jgi:hypothetical protein
MSTSMGMEAISFSEQATAARRDWFAGSNSGVVGQNVRDVGDVVKKFTAPPPGAGVPPTPRSVIVGAGPPSTSAAEPAVQPPSSRSHAVPP